jgi:hypothetical protein
VTLFIDKSGNYLFAGWRTASCKSDAYDSHQKNDDHNRIDSSRFLVVEILPKGKPFHASHYIKHILQLILELHLESVRLRLVVRADNAKPHTARQSEELCKKNSLRIAPCPPYSHDLHSSNFSYSGM